MFTGIIEAVGRLRAINTSGGGARVTIDTATLDLSDVKKPCYQPRVLAAIWFQGMLIR